MFGLVRSRPRSARTAPGERIYAVGDVHGRYDLLEKLLQLVVEHWQRADRQPERCRVLFLGDIIDRGPDSARCLACVRELVANAGAQLLLGNHEDMLLAAADGNPAAQRAWLEHGGYATLKSYGIDPPAKGEDTIDFADRLVAGIPPEDLALLRSAEHSYASGDYLFVHAGVRPGVALDRQLGEDLYSIREEFTASDVWHGAVIVHGHSMVDFVETRQNRIACDTGAYRTNRLSCVCLHDDLQTILST